MVIVSSESGSFYYPYCNCVLSITLCRKAFAKRQRINHFQVIGYGHGPLDI